MYGHQKAGLHASLVQSLGGLVCLGKGPGCSARGGALRALLLLQPRRASQLAAPCARGTHRDFF
jgi:hypothetical protein